MVCGMNYKIKMYKKYQKDTQVRDQLMLYLEVVYKEYKKEII